MPRQPRFDIPGVPQHVMQTGGGDMPIFTCADDCREYLEQLRVTSLQSGCEIHAYALAPSSVQLLVTGQTSGAVARMMRRVGQAYSRYANTRHARREGCWQGRYSSCPVGGRRHVLLACRHVERSAERSGLAETSDWSSHACNAYGSPDVLVSPHPAYVALASSLGERLYRYRQLVDQGPDIDHALTMHTRQGRAWGSVNFLRKVSALRGEQSPARPPGRPRKRQRNAGMPLACFLSPFLLTGWSPVVETLCTGS